MFSILKLLQSYRALLTSKYAAVKIGPVIIIKSSHFWLRQVSQCPSVTKCSSPLINYRVISLIIKSSYWSLCPLIGRYVLLLVVMSSYWPSSPLIGHQVLSLVIMSSSPLVGYHVVKSSHWSASPLIGNQVLSLVIKSSHW